MNKYQLTLVLTSKESNQCVAMPSCENGDSNSIIVRLNYCTSSLPGVGTRVGVRLMDRFGSFSLSQHSFKQVGPYSKLRAKKVGPACQQWSASFIY